MRGVFALSLLVLSVEPTKFFQAGSLLNNSLKCHTLLFPSYDPCYNLLQVEKDTPWFSNLCQKIQLFEENVSLNKHLNLL